MTANSYLCKYGILELIGLFWKLILFLSINDQWINDLTWIFNFSFQIRCPRLDQDFSSLDLVRDYLQYGTCSTFYFFLSFFFFTVILIIFDKRPWYASYRNSCMPSEREGIRELYKQWRQQQWECFGKSLHDYENA